MRLALISDIHGNGLALDAVLADIALQGADAIVCLGDIVSGPMDPAGVVERLMGLGCQTVMGNHDRWVASYAHDALETVDQFVQGQLSAEQRSWLGGLKATDVFGGEVFLCHGTPRSDEKTWLDAYYSGRQVTLPGYEAVSAEAEGFDFPVMACGHSHVARSVRLKDGRMVVNPGAVGLQVIHGSPDARYGLLDRRDGVWSVSLRAVPYDHLGAAEQARRNGFGHWHDVLCYGWDGPEGLFN